MEKGGVSEGISEYNFDMNKCKNECMYYLTWNGEIELTPRALQKEFFLLWCTDLGRNPITNKNELHGSHVQKEIKRISAGLASFPEARSLGRPAIYFYKLTIFVLLFFVYICKYKHIFI